MSTTPHLGLALIPAGTEDWQSTYYATLNTLDSAIYALQTGGSTGPAGPAGPTGPVGLIWSGPWNNSTAYIATDVVTYNGGTYFALAGSTNVAPDVNPNTWAQLAAPGLPGPTGAQGPAGPPGTGTTVTFPISLAEGGTGAIDPTDARTNLIAAMSGLNADILGLAAVTCDTVRSGRAGITITSAGGEGNALIITNGSVTGGITSAGVAYLAGLFLSGGITCGALTVSGDLLTGTISSPVGGGSVTIADPLIAGLGLTIQGVTPSATSSQVAVGTDTFSTATAGGGQTVPSTVLTYLQVNVKGVLGKIPIFAV